MTATDPLRDHGGYIRLIADAHLTWSLSMATMDLDTRAALERLIDVAQADTGQSHQVADLLLAWYNAGENGGFDFTNFWAIDDALVADSLRLITWISRNRAYPDELGYGDQFKAIWKAWRG